MLDNITVQLYKDILDITVKVILSTVQEWACWEIAWGHHAIIYVCCALTIA
jgi:hypothetical protein